MIFYKSVSSGNDFIHMESTGIKPATKTELVKNLCDRNSGAGADGMVFYKIRDNKEGVDFEIFNRDGSEAELSGNGMAGLSALLFYLGEFENRVTLHTKAGSKTNELQAKHADTFRLKVEIGRADFSRCDFFPFLQEGKIGYEHQGTTFHPVSVGNPHAVVLPEEEPSFEDLTILGRQLENAAIFPQKTNVEFVLPPMREAGLNKENPECRVYYYERGVGHTYSSSTGSAAVFAVLHKLGIVKDQLTIDTSREKIKIFTNGDIYVENFTKIVYKGIYLKSEDPIAIK